MIPAVNTDAVGVIFSGQEETLSMSPRAGAYRLRTYLKDNNIDIDVIDYFYQWSLEEIFQVLDKFKKLHFIGFSSTFLTGSKLTIIKDLKEKYPDIKIVVGGAETDLTSVACPEYIDNVFLGFCEQTFLKYIVSLINGSKDGLQWETHPRGNLKYILPKESHRGLNNDYRVDWEDRDLVHGLNLPIEISRGCIFSCSFCGFPLIGKNKDEYLRSAENLAAEFQRNYELYGVTSYSFADDTLNDTTYKLEVIRKALEMINLKIKFSCNLKPELIHVFPEQIDLLIEIGMRSGIVGIESFYNPSRKAIKKGLSIDNTLKILEQIKKKKPDVSLQSGFIVGLPYETKESCEATHKWLLDHNHALLDAWYWQPLHIFTQFKLLKSEMTVDPAKFGYRMLSDIYWESDIMTLQEARDLSARFNKEAEAQQRYAGFSMAELCNYGYDEKDLFNMIRTELDFKRVREQRRAHIEKYKSMRLI
jgi:radical SAM superfamily enzyme YgiQ (UPF0313 family)